MKRIFNLLLVLVIVIGIYVPAHATLINRGTDTLGNRLIYEDDLNITWYDYANSGDTWQNQVDWAEALSVTFGSTVFDDWRLPTTLQPDTTCSSQLNYGGGFPVQGYALNCTGSEMGHLYYTELGNQAGSIVVNDGDFNNMLVGTRHWSGTEYAVYPSDVWDFSFYGGYQGLCSKDCQLYAIAVRPGDVSTSVPEPATMFLLGSGLVGMAVLRKRLGRSEG